MAGSVLNSREILRIDRLVYVPVVLLLVGIWAVTVDFKLGDRTELLIAAEDELYGSVDTLADAETLLRQNAAWSERERKYTRDGLMQNELHSHPGASFWMESGGVVFAGSPVNADPATFISATETREGFAVHAARPKEAVLVGWRATLNRWLIILSVVTLAALATAALLARTLRRSAIAEADLRKRDAILSTINNAATALAAAQDYETVIRDVLASIGTAVDVDRVMLRTFARFTDVGRIFEWHAPDLAPLADTGIAASEDFETFYKPEQLAQAMRGEPIDFAISDAPADLQDLLRSSNTLSSLIFGFIIDGQVNFVLNFSEARRADREWTATEKDTLRTLAGVIAAAITRTIQARERSKVEAKLFNRDAILQAVTDSAAKLLSTEDPDATINETLTTLGPALGVNRVYVTTLTLTPDQRVLANVTHEWFRPGMVPAKNHPGFTDADVTAVYPPEKFANANTGQEESFFLDDYTEEVRRNVIDMGMHAILSIPLILEGQFHGNLAFTDDSPDRRSWTPTEIRTLKTLTQLVGAALDRAHQTRERIKAEAKLFNRDAILQAMTKTAAQLLNTSDPDAAITETLAGLGPALGLSRIYLGAFRKSDDGRIFYSLTHEWFKAGMIAGKGHPTFTDYDVTALYSTERLAAATAGQEDAFFAKDLPGADQAALVEIGTLASLAVPVIVEGEFRGNLVFADDSVDRAAWTPTEISTLRTLTQLVGAALARARYLEQRREAEANIQMRERGLEGISQGIAITDLNAPGRPVIYANPAFAALVRYPITEIIGRDAGSFVSGPSTDGVEERMRQAIAERKPWRVERTIMRKDGTTFLNASTSTFIFDDAGQLTHLVSVNEDVTELRKREELLLEARKMEGIGHLTGGIAHEFNNLLTAIRSNAEDLRDDLQDELQRTQAEIVLEAADRGAGLVAQLLAFARKQELAPENVAINALVDAFAKQLTRTMPANIEVETKFAEDIPAVHIDPSRLEGVIQHLVSNARDAMPDGGTLTIETSLKVLDEAEAAEMSARPGAYALIAVTDSGTGMSREVVAKAFTPFFTTKEVGSGTGLGLSIVDGFVKQSGGYARIYSELGMGTVVKLYLPVIVAAAAEEAVSPPRAPGAGAILIVEDDDEVRESVGTRLKGLGYQVTAATNAQEAIDILKGKPHFDLVFSDIIMPGGMNGADLVGEVRSRWPATGVLLMSGYTETTIFAKIKLPPDARLLSKPFSNHELASAVREALARRADKVA